jgi:NADH-quinone oxidoreductase subunit N
MLLFGMSLVYGFAGTTDFSGLAALFAAPATVSKGVVVGLVFMIVGFSFKVSAVPFHMWAPDVYEGAPTPVTGFMSVGPKAAGFAVLLRIFVAALPQLAEGRWQDAMWAIAALTMAIGNIVALVQPNIKRMLAYSSIAHAGYVAVALTAAGSRNAQDAGQAATAALFYLLAYSATNLGAFAVLAAVGRSEDRLTNLGDFAGLARKRPGLAALLTVFLLSLAGIPGTVGFAGKFFIFRSAVQSGLTGLAVVGALTTVASFYYYLYVIVQMYMREPREEFTDVAVSPCTGLVLAATAAVVLYLGVLPGRMLDWAFEAAQSLLSF